MFEKLFDYIEKLEMTGALPFRPVRGPFSEFQDPLLIVALSSPVGRDKSKVNKIQQIVKLVFMDG